MNATTYLALMTKAKRVFERNGTFLSFPVLSPLTYPPEKLSFGGIATDILTLGDFSRLVNQIPRGPLYQPDEEIYLWDVYHGLFEPGVATLAAGTPSPEETAAYQRARELLYITTPDGRLQDSPTRLVYKQHYDAWIAALEEYKTAQVTAETTSDPAVKERWRTTDEPALRSKVAKVESDWASEGFRHQVEEAERVEQRYARLSPQQLWNEWGQAYMPDIDNMTDVPFAPTAFSPADPFDAEWPTFTLSADEIGALVAEAPAELKGALDLTGGAPPVDWVTFQFRSVVLTRPWFRKEVFAARFWRLTPSASPLSDGGSPPQGRCPAYISAVVFARNMIEGHRVEPAHNTGGSPDPGGRRINYPGAPYVMEAGLAPNYRVERLRAAGLARNDRIERLAEAGLVPNYRVERLGRAAAPAEGVDRRRAVMTPQAARSLKRLSESTFNRTPTMPPPAEQPRGDASGPPVPPLAATLTGDITLLAFICRRLPKCPDPDPALTWAG